jgi:crotonobetainyl-CoA:carnitine CoA-transferase CaiB-like acyl-CoA transferase
MHPRPETRVVGEPRMTASQPLAGTKVLDLTRALSGPFCTTLLADLGADVIKVEGVDGDMIRLWGPFTEGTSLYHLAVNRNKRSISLDLRSDEGRDMILELAKRSDVLVENFRPGVLAKMGLDPTRLEDIAPHLIVASVTGFGPEGHLRDDAAFDQIAQGMGGLMSVTGLPETGPTRVGIPISDILAGMTAAIGVTAALSERKTSGRGTRVEASLLESVLSVLTFQAQRYLSVGEVAGPMGNDHPIMSPYGVYHAADGPFNLAVGTEAQWRALCMAINSPELATDPSFADGELRRVNRERLRVELERRLAERPASAWLAALRAAGIPAGPIHDMAGVFADDQVVALRMVEQVSHPVLGSTSVLRGPLRLGGEATPVHRAAPLLGQHTREVLAGDLGLPPGEVSRLLSAGVVGEAVPASTVPGSSDE